MGLLQIGTWEHGTYLIDPFSVREEICKKLKPLLESDQILKIFHDVRNDVKWLQANFDIFLVSVLDTQLMQEVYTGQTMSGLNTLTKTYYPAIKLPEETLSDWRLRPDEGMTSDQEKYAINDVYFLLRVFDHLRKDVIFHN